MLLGRPVCRAVPACRVDHYVTVSDGFENGNGFGVRQSLKRRSVDGQDLVSCVLNNNNTAV